MSDASVHTCAARRRGFTLLEALIAISILGIILAVGFPLLGTPDARAFSNDVNALVQRARFEAVKRDTPVAVRFDTQAGMIELRAPAEATVAAACGDADVVVVATADTSAYRNTSFAVSGVLATDRSIVWLPNGRPVNCAGSPNVARSIVVSDGRRQVTLSVDIGGRIVTQ